MGKPPKCRIIPSYAHSSKASQKFYVGCGSLAHRTHPKNMFQVEQITPKKCAKVYHRAVFAVVFHVKRTHEDLESTLKAP